MDELTSQLEEYGNATLLNDSDIELPINIAGIPVDEQGVNALAAVGLRLAGLADNWSLIETSAVIVPVDGSTAQEILASHTNVSDLNRALLTIIRAAIEDSFASTFPEYLPIKPGQM